MPTIAVSGRWSGMTSSVPILRPIDTDQHDHEQEEGHHGAGIDDDLDGRDEVGIEQRRRAPRSRTWSVRRPMAEYTGLRAATMTRTPPATADEREDHEDEEFSVHRAASRESRVVESRGSRVKRSRVKRSTGRGSRVASQSS